MISFSSGYITNAIIYEKGTACASDADCTTYSNSQCKSGLCYQPAPAPVVETFNMCPGVTDMSDQARMSFLDTHNKLRSRVAKGLEADGIAAGAFAPTAKQMTKMVGTSLEKTSVYFFHWSVTIAMWRLLPRHGVLDACTNTRPTLSGRVSERTCTRLLYWTSTRFNQEKMSCIKSFHPFSCVFQASNAWWSELKDFGVGSDNILTSAVFGRGVGHYTQMAWETTTDLGCYVAHCPTFTYSVCQYGPA